MKQNCYIGGGHRANGVRFKTLCLTLTLCLGASKVAQAGSYVVSYSGGTVTTSSSFGSSTSQSYTAANGSYGGGGGAGWGMGTSPVTGQDTATSGSAICSGDITATFTWQPTGIDDPPPTDVVIAETANVVAGYSGTAPATKAEGDNTFGFPWQTYYYNSFTPPGGHSGGTRYSLKSNPGSSFTIKATPTAALTGTGSQGKNSSGNASVSYKATATPLEIVLTGGIGPRNSKSFLVGQLVSGSISTGGLTADPNGFNWSVSGGEPFKTWTPTQTAGTATTFLGYAGSTTSQTSFCFRKYTGSQATVSCSLHLAVPTGALPTAGFSPSLNQQCTVDKPSNTLAVYIGSVQGIVADRTPGPNPLAMQLVGGEAYDPNVPAGILSGILWDGTVTTPTGYGSGGGWNYTQLITPHRIVRMAGVDHKPVFEGQQVLDATFGYASVSDANHNLYSDNGNRVFEGDSPSQPFYVSQSGSYTEVLDSFVTYTLYKPPGAGSQYVPLKSLKWFWQGQAQPNSSGIWQLSNTNAQWSFLDENFPPHPMWPDTEPTQPVPFSPPLP